MIMAEHNRRVERKRMAAVADPSSWTGRDHDGWWIEQDRQRKAGR